METPKDEVMPMSPNNQTVMLFASAPTQPAAKKINNFSQFIFARALHVIGVLFWIGGVAFVTTVLIPSLKKLTNTQNRLELFEQLEGKFGTAP